MLVSQDRNFHSILRKKCLADCHFWNQYWLGERGGGSLKEGIGVPTNVMSIAGLLIWYLAWEARETQSLSFRVYIKISDPVDHTKR